MSTTLFIPTLRNARISATLFGVVGIAGLIAFVFSLYRNTNDGHDASGIAIVCMVLVVNFLIMFVVTRYFRLIRVLVKVPGGWDLTDRFRAGVWASYRLGDDVLVIVRQRHDGYYEVILQSSNLNVVADAFSTEVNANRLATVIREFLAG